MLLSEIFSVDRIKVDLASKTKTELFHEMVSFLADTGAISDPNRIMDALWQRESVMSTLVAPNIALPQAGYRLRCAGREAGARCDASDRRPV